MEPIQNQIHSSGTLHQRRRNADQPLMFRGHVKLVFQSQPFNMRPVRGFECTACFTRVDSGQLAAGSYLAGNVVQYLANAVHAVFGL